VLSPQPVDSLRFLKALAEGMGHGMAEGLASPLEQARDVSPGGGKARDVCAREFAACSCAKFSSPENHRLPAKLLRIDKFY
jgi:hypothetical protein